MATIFEITKSLLSPPGDTIQEPIDFIGMSQAELAERMGRPKEKINEVIKGKERITTAAAFKLENVLRYPCRFLVKSGKNFPQRVIQIATAGSIGKEKRLIGEISCK